MSAAQAPGGQRVATAAVPSSPAEDPASLPQIGRLAWPGSHPLDAELEVLAAAELERLRARFNPTAAGLWGIVYNPFYRTWYGLHRGHDQVRYTITVATPQALEDWIACGQYGMWRTA